MIRPGPLLTQQWIFSLIGMALLIVAAVSYWVWTGPFLEKLPELTAEYEREDVHDHALVGSHDRSHSAQSLPSLELSLQARNNLGLTSEYLRPIKLETFRRSITIPAVVIAKPGRTQLQVSSPLNGVITHVHAVTGEAVTPGALLFEIRLSYEDLVESQMAFLKSLGDLAIEKREISRLEEVTSSGAVSGKILLERRYAKEKLEATIRSQREGLKLHGLSDRQVEAIANEGKLLRDLQIVAPDIDQHSDDEELRLSQGPYHSISFAERRDPPTEAPDHTVKLLIIDDLHVKKGQAVVAGEKLCSLSDFSQLFIEGQAFEQDGAVIGRAVQLGWTVEAVLPDDDGEQVVNGLTIAYVGNAVAVASRTLSFFVELSNEVLGDQTNTQGQRHVTWRYRPGQRLQLRVPTEEWRDQIVLPIDAVASEGPDWFVFQKHGSHFDRRSVHVKHRDQRVAVIANDGSIAVGSIVALRSAHQLQMAWKNQLGSSQSTDSHAGHSH